MFLIQPVPHPVVPGPPPGQAFLIASQAKCCEFPAALYIQSELESPDVNEALEPTFERVSSSRTSNCASKSLVLDRVIIPLLFLSQA